MKIVVYGTEWCPDCTRAIRFLDKHNIKYKYVDIGKNPEQADKVIDLNEKIGKGPYKSVPTIVIDDKKILSEPSTEELKKAVKFK